MRCLCVHSSDWRGPLKKEGLQKGCCKCFKNVSGLLSLKIQIFPKPGQHLLMTCVLLIDGLNLLLTLFLFLSWPLT